MEWQPLIKLPYNFEDTLTSSKGLATELFLSSSLCCCSIGTIQRWIPMEISGETKENKRKFQWFFFTSSDNRKYFSSTNSSHFSDWQTYHHFRRLIALKLELISRCNNISILNYFSILLRMFVIIDAGKKNFAISLKYVTNLELYSNMS